MRLADYGVEADVGHVLLPYGDHRGAERLRALVAAGSGNLRPDDVLVTAGAAAGLFIINSALLEPGTHALICSPNYATNLETPLAIGADVERLELRFEDGWQLDLERLAQRLRPDTRVVSVTYPHNPTGSTISAEQLGALVEIVDNHPVARLLVDETYRDLAYETPLPMATSLSPRALGVSSMSKTYGLPGLRVGWLTCRDEALMETFLAAKEQIFITGAVLDEELTARVLERRHVILPSIHERVASQLAVVREWIESNETFEWVEPQAGAVCFLRFEPTSTSIASTACCSRSTARTWAEATGSTRTGVSSASASPGRRRRSLLAASGHWTKPPLRLYALHGACSAADGAPLCSPQDAAAAQLRRTTAAPIASGDVQASRAQALAEVSRAAVCMHHADARREGAPMGLAAT